MYKNIAADQTFVRENNLSTILRYIFFNSSPVFRAQLAERIGLNKSTVSSLVQELMERNLIHETGMNSIGNLGRPATFLEVDPQAGFIIGVDLGLEFISIMIADFKGKTVWQRKIPINSIKSQEETITRTNELIQDAITICKEKNNRILGLGVAVPGMVDTNEGVLIYAPHLDWHDVPFKKIFSESTGLDVVYIENDANASAIGEHLYGVARETMDFIFVFAGIGIGSGLFLKGKLYSGMNGYAGEVGHMPIIAEPFQNQCDCGNLGCWETYANQNLFIQRMQEKLKTKKNAIISSIMAAQNEPLSISVLKRAADENDSDSIEIFREAGRAIGIGIAGLINIFNPDKVIVGGPMSISGDHLLPAINESVKNHSLPVLNKDVEILISAFGPDATVIGSVALVANHILSKPTIVERRWPGGEKEQE